MYWFTKKTERFSNTRNHLIYRLLNVYEPTCKPLFNGGANVLKFFNDRITTKR